MHDVPALSIDDGETLASDDAPLVQAAREEPAAFGLLYQRYRHRVYAYLRTRTPTDEDAADLTQLVFLRALDALPRFRGQGNEFAGWLFRIARNAANDFHRRKRTTVTWDLLPEALQPAAEQDLPAIVLHREAIDRLRALILALDPDKRELLALRFGAGLTAGQIAAVVGKSEAATKKQLYRTFQSLKERYHELP